MLDILTKAAPFTSRPVVQIDPASASVLSQALNGRLYEKDKVEKKSYHVINAFGLRTGSNRALESAAQDHRGATATAELDERVMGV